MWRCAQAGPWLGQRPAHGSSKLQIRCCLSDGKPKSHIALVTSLNAAGVVATTDFAVACQGVCGGVPRRGPGLPKVQLMAANCAIYRDQAAALAAYAEPGVKVGADSFDTHVKPCLHDP
jgi:hypothetical protein